MNIYLAKLSVTKTVMFDKKRRATKTVLITGKTANEAKRDFLLETEKFHKDFFDPDTFAFSFVVSNVNLIYSPTK